MTKISKEEYVKNWLIKAQNDLTIAKDERYLKEDNFITDGICFHCQQAVEKSLKAFLAYHETDFSKTHNLEALSELCTKIDIDFDKLSFGNLTDYGIAVRYPDDFYMPSLEEADRSIKIAEEVKEFISKKLGIKLNI